MAVTLGLRIILRGGRGGHGKSRTGGGKRQYELTHHGSPSERSMGKFCASSLDGGLNALVIRRSNM
jgi:hypothetical protein